MKDRDELAYKMGYLLGRTTEINLTEEQLAKLLKKQKSPFPTETELVWMLECEEILKSNG